MEAIKELRNLEHSMMPPPFENNEFENILMAPLLTILILQEK